MENSKRISGVVFSSLALLYSCYKDHHVAAGSCTPGSILPSSNVIITSRQYNLRIAAKRIDETPKHKHQQ